MMNTERMLRELHDELRAIDTAIRRLERVRDGKGKRGRKSMGADERQEVSARMKKYWAGTRAVIVTRLRDKGTE
jgi:hypothetical protein